MRSHSDESPERIGSLLSHLRLARGLSQLRLAELLCAAAGTPTVTRHEVSRWERGERVPGRFWREWLAVVLDVPLERLEAAADGHGGGRPASTAGRPVPLWDPPTAAGLLAELDHASVADLRELAQEWLAATPRTGAVGRLCFGPVIRPGETAPAETLQHLQARLADLRRMDDVVGGLDLAGRADRELRAAIASLREVGEGRLRIRALRLIAGYAQFAGWTHADAGDELAARRAYRVALRAATAAGDRPLAAHVLGSLSHQSLSVGAPDEALALARAGYAGARADGTPLLQALLLHRVALANARCGERRAAEVALVDAERAADRSEPAREPEWLYWLDPAELTAMAGRCLAVLGRSLRATGLLSQRPRTRLGPRTAVLYSAWLVRSLLTLGEVERAGHLATRILRLAVAAGSARAATELRYLHPLLLRHRDVPIVRRYERLAAAASEYLPDPGGADTPARRPPTARLRVSR